MCASSVLYKVKSSMTRTKQSNDIFGQLKFKNAFIFILKNKILSIFTDTKNGSNSKYLFFDTIFEQFVGSKIQIRM